jgi:hypothetical protein
MAKPTYAKLKLTSNISPKELEWGEQKIEVKQYLSIQDKLKMITEILGLTADENRFYNVGRLKVFKTLKILEYYTNLSITGKQKEDPTKLYDELMVSNFFDAVENLIPGIELNEINDILYDTIDQVYKYQNSAYGIMEAMSQDYNNLDLDASELQKKIADPENLQLLKEVLTKMG